MSTADPSPASRPSPPPLTPADRRWAILASELEFDQLAHARAHAEGWRNALAAATTIVGTASLLIGRERLELLAQPWRLLVVGLLVVAFAALLTAFAMTVLAAHGRPGTQIRADGAALQTYVAAESQRVMRRLIPIAAVLSVLGVALIFCAAITSWLAPVAAADESFWVSALVEDQEICGRLIAIDDDDLLLDVETARRSVVRRIALAELTDLTSQSSCAP